MSITNETSQANTRRRYRRQESEWQKPTRRTLSKIRKKRKKKGKWLIEPRINIISKSAHFLLKSLKDAARFICFGKCFPSADVYLRLFRRHQGHPSSRRCVKDVGEPVGLVTRSPISFQETAVSNNVIAFGFSLIVTSPDITLTLQKAHHRHCTCSRLDSSKSPRQ